MNKITDDKFCSTSQEELNELIQDASEKKQNEFKTFFGFFKKSLKTTDIDANIENELAMETDTDIQLFMKSQLKVVQVNQMLTLKKQALVIQLSTIQ